MEVEELEGGGSAGTRLKGARCDEWESAGVFLSSIVKEERNREEETYWRK